MLGGVTLLKWLIASPSQLGGQWYSSKPTGLQVEGCKTSPKLTEADSPERCPPISASNTMDPSSSKDYLSPISEDNGAKFILDLHRFKKELLFYPPSIVGPWQPGSEEDWHILKYISSVFCGFCKTFSNFETKSKDLFFIRTVPINTFSADLAF